MGVYRKRDKKTGKLSQKWWIDYYFNGRRVREPVSTSKKEAETVYFQRVNSINENKHPILKKQKNKKIRFVEFSEKYIIEHSKPLKRSFKSDISMLKNLMPFFGDYYIDEIKSYHAVEYRKLRSQEKGKNRSNSVSPTTINRELALLRNMLNLAIEWFELEIKPIKITMVKEEQKERILTQEEIRKIVENAEPPLKYMILIAINTGMRKGEILKLEWNQINLEQGFITITAHKTKSRRIRRIPLNNSTHELLNKLHLVSDDNYIFTNPKTGKPYVDIKKSWTGLLKRLNIKGLRFHDLRHTFATYSLFEQRRRFNLSTGNSGAFKHINNFKIYQSFIGRTAKIGEQF